MISKDSAKGFLLGCLCLFLAIVMIEHIIDYTTTLNSEKTVVVEEVVNEEAQQKKKTIEPTLNFYIDAYTGCHYLSLDDKTLIQRQSKLGQVGCKRLKLY